jgi:organic radical activating enzyme
MTIASNGAAANSGGEWQEGVAPEDFEALDFRHWFLQPRDGNDRNANTDAVVRYCLAHPRWRLSLQAHKIVGIR